MIKVTPYIETAGSERFKKFLLVPFLLNMLDKVTEDKIVKVETLFDGWRGKDMNSWHKFNNYDSGYILSFFPSYYEIVKKNGLKQQFPLPDTLNDFINDMCRMNVDLYWTSWIDTNFEPKDYLHQDGIKQYYVDLLGKLDKSFELQ